MEMSAKNAQCDLCGVHSTGSKNANFLRLGPDQSCRWRIRTDTVSETSLYTRFFDDAAYFARASCTTFLNAITRVKQSGQTLRTGPRSARDSGRMLEASIKRLHSGHRFILEGSLVISQLIRDRQRLGLIFSTISK